MMTMLVYVFRINAIYQRKEKERWRWRRETDGGGGEKPTEVEEGEGETFSRRKEARVFTCRHILI